MRYSWLMLLIGSLFLIVACAPAQPKKAKAPIILPPGTLDRAAVATLFSDRTVKSESGSGRITLTYYNPDGSLRQLQYGEKRDGRWWIRDDGRICLKLEDGDKKCRVIVNDNGIYKKYVVKKNNRHRHVITYHWFKPGNLVDN